MSQTLVATSPTADLAGAIASEWTKLRSVRSTWWCLLGAAGLMLVTAPLLGGSSANNFRDAGIDTTIAVGEPVIESVGLVQFALTTLAMLVITAEYASGSIRATLQWVPARGVVLLAKAAVVVPVTFVAGVLLGVFGVGVTWPVLFEYARFEGAGTVGDVLGIGVYLAAVSALSLGVGAAVRSTAGALTTVFMLLVAVPGALLVTGNATLTRVADYLPSVAGMNFMTGDTEPYPRAAGLLILLAWAGAALLAGHIVLRRRDA